jgi:hypothetical protein
MIGRALESSLMHILWHTRSTDQDFELIQIEQERPVVAMIYNPPFVKKWVRFEAWVGANVPTCSQVHLIVICPSYG